MQVNTLLRYLFGCIAIGLLLSYIIFQARIFIAGPQVSLTEEPSVRQTAHSLTLKGRAENITEITLNGRQITTDEDGYFEELLVLENGYTIASIKAKDRYGRTTELTREFVYSPLSLFMK